MKHFFKWLLFALLGLTVVIGGAMLWLSKTESGLRWIVDRVPQTVSVEQLEGNLSDFTFSKLQVSTAGTKVDIESGSIKWRLWGVLTNKIDIETLQLNKVQIVLPKSEQSKQAYSPWQGITLPVDVHLQQFALNNLTVIQNQQDIVSLDTIRSRAAIVNNRLTIDELTAGIDDNKFTASGKVNLRARPSGKVHLIHTLSWQSQDRIIQTKGSINGTWKKLQLEQSLSSPLTASATIELQNALSKTLRWDGRIQTSEPPPQKLGSQTIDIGAGSFETTGEFSPGDGLENLLISLKGRLSGGNETISRWALDTDVLLNEDKLTIKSLKLDQQRTDKPGTLSFNGSVNGVSSFLEEATNATAIADLTGNWSNVGWPLDAPANILTNGEFALNGAPQDFAVTAKIRGKSNDAPLTADINLRARGDVYDINMASLRSGRSTAAVTGKISERLDLNWSVSSPDLTEFLPTLGGTLVSQGRISGTRAAPVFDATAQSEEIRYLDYQMTQLDASAKGSLVSLAKPLKIRVDVAQLTQGSAAIAQSLGIDLGGTQKKYDFNLNTKLFNQSDLQARADGGLTQTGWQARLLEFNLDDPTYDQWQLQDVVQLNGQGAYLKTERACLINNAQSICLKVSADEQEIAANGTVNDVNLSNLNPALSLYDSRVKGLLNGEFEYTKRSIQTNSEIQAEFVTQDSEALIARATEQGPSVQRVFIRSAKVTVSQLEQLALTATAELKNGDEISAELGVAAPIESADFMSSELTGRVIGQFKDLPALPLPTATLKFARGELNIDTTLGGSLAEPSVGMQTRLSNGRAELPQLGLNLNDINLQATSEGQQMISVSGGLSSGEGELSIDGQLDFAKLNEPRVQLSLSGDDLQLMKTPEISVKGSLDTQILLEKELLKLTGEVSLANADLDFQSPEDAILVSEDVVFVGQAEKKPGIEQRIDLILNLGEQTRIRAQGFDGHLSGQLTLLQEPGGLLRGKGQIDIKQGRYTAYSQKLKIDKGQLIFSGGSIDDPNLDLRAQKTVDTTTAGVNVTGLASAPILRLYSTPSMQDQDILSVLIFDKPLGELGSADGLTLLRIANSLRGNGESGVTKLTGRIQNSLGLSNLELQLAGDAPSIVAGKQLFSKLYIGYGYGLLDAAQSLILKYKLSKAWSINADLGADSGADLRYQIER